MKRVAVSVWFGAFLWLLVAPVSFGATGTVEELDALVGRWLALRATRAEEERTWKRQQVQWSEEVRLLEVETSTLRAELDEASASASAVERERATVLKRKEHLHAVLDGVCPALDRAESQLRAWVAVVPPALDDGLSTELAGLPATQEQVAALPLTKRVQRVVALYSRIETLQNNIHASRELLDTGAGERRLVDVLYLGLARGMAVAPGDGWAAIGVPTVEGWRWEPRPEAAGRIRAALDVLSRRGHVQRVALPVQVHDTHVEPTTAAPDRSAVEGSAR